MSGWLGLLECAAARGRCPVPRCGGLGQGPPRGSAAAFLGKSPGVGLTCATWFVSVERSLKAVRARPGRSQRFCGLAVALGVAAGPQDLVRHQLRGREAWCPGQPRRAQCPPSRVHHAHCRARPRPAVLSPAVPHKAVQPCDGQDAAADPGGLVHAPWLWLDVYENKS